MYMYTCLLRVYGHYVYIYSYSAEIDFRQTSDSDVYKVNPHTVDNSDGNKHMYICPGQWNARMDNQRYYCGYPCMDNPQYPVSIPFYNSTVRFC